MRHRIRQYDGALSRVMLSKAIGFVLVAGIVTGGVVKPPVADPGIARAQSAAGQFQRFVSVLDDDRPVLGLGVEDFVVEEDGVRREVLRVEPAAVPFDLAILVDEGMVASSNLSHVREALTTFVQVMAGHDVSLFSFGNQRRTVVPFTKNTQRLTQATRTFAGFPESSAYLLEAMLETAHDLARRQSQRPALVVFTRTDRGIGDMAIRGPGFSVTRLTPDAARDRTADGVVEELLRTGVVVNAVVTTRFEPLGFTDSRSDGLATITSGAGGFRWLQENRERERVLDKAPTDTGGLLYKVSSTSGIAERLVRIADELLNQYLVTYARPEMLVPPEETRVDVIDDDLTVRSTPNRLFIHEVPTTVYVLDGTIVEPNMVYHHSPDCPGFGGLGGQNAVAVRLDALGENGSFCPFCPHRQQPD